MPPPLLFVFLLLLAGVVRGYAILPSQRPSKTKRGRRGSVIVAVFLGSGGHTSESLQMVSSLDFRIYKPRVYVISEGDIFSSQKATELEASHGSQNRDYRIITIPRARRVHQSFLSTPPTFVWSLLNAIYHVFLGPLIRRQSFADVLILNGPGTCVPICLAAYLSRFVGASSPHIVYVESFARVKRLSLSGKILRPFVDSFIVQWPDLLSNGGRGECRGWLV